MVGPWHHHFMRNSSQRDSWHVHLLVFETEASCFTVLASCASQKLQGVSVVPGLGPAMQTSSIWLTQGFFWKCSSVFRFEGCGMQTQTSGSFWACGGLGVQLHTCCLHGSGLTSPCGQRAHLFLLAPDPGASVHCRLLSLLHCLLLWQSLSQRWENKAFPLNISFLVTFLHYQLAFRI